ncbi:MAG: MBL fold metallo-hydrolase, partial [Planctomycetia bacterium]|nr:MBL fold metallo-hydrolase [Planctomycetia bacterium]
MRKQNRRKFLEMCTLSAGAIMLSGTMNNLSAKDNVEEIGKPLSPWQEGNLDIHYIYTGAGENMFLI